MNAWAIAVSGFGAKISEPEKMYSFYWEKYDTEYSDEEYRRIKSPEQWAKLDERYKGMAKPTPKGVKDLPPEIRNKYFPNRL